MDTDIKRVNATLDKTRTTIEDFERWATNEVARLKAEAQSKLDEASGVETALLTFRQFRKTNTGA